jgi:hypothetical protein
MASARGVLAPPEFHAAWRDGAARDLDAAGHAVVALLSTQPTPHGQSGTG